MFKKTLFKSNFLSYLLVFSLPLLIFIILVYTYFVQILTDEILTSNQFQLHQVVRSVDEEMDKIRNHAKLLDISHIPYRGTFEQNPLQAFEKSRELQKIVVANPFLDEIFLHYTGEDNFYGTRGTNRISHYFQLRYQFDNWSEASVLEDEYKLFSPITFVSHVEDLQKDGDAGSNLIIYKYPVTPQPHQPRSILYFTIRESAIEAIVGNQLQAGEQMFIADSFGDIVYSNSSDAARLQHTLNDHIQKNAANIGSGLRASKARDSVLRLDDGKDYLLITEQSQNNLWQYVHLVPRQNIFAKISALYMIFWFAIASLVFIGLLIIYYFVSKNYKPIEALGKFSRQIAEDSPESGDELSTIQYALKYLHIQNSDLHQHLYSNRTAIKDHLLFRLLSGQIENLETFNRQGEPFGITYSHTLFLVAVIYLPQSAEDAHNLISQDIVERIEGFFEEPFEVYVRDDSQHEQYVLLACLPVSAKHAFAERLRTLCKDFHDKLSPNTEIGVSTFESDLSHLPMRYLEAVNLSDYRFISSTGAIHFPEDEVENSDRFVVEQLLESIPVKLHKIFNHQSFDELETYIEEIQTFIQENNISVFAARMLGFCLINSTIREAYRLRSNKYIMNLDPPNLIVVSKLKNFEEINQFLVYYINVLKNELRGISALQEDKQHMQKISSYIGEVYTDCNLSVQSIADHFGLSLSQLSKEFKNEYGINISEYITQVRIQAAKTMLLENKLSIREIAEKIGYLNANSFTRRFRQMTGVTPSEYGKFALQIDQPSPGRNNRS